MNQVETLLNVKQAERRSRTARVWEGVNNEKQERVSLVIWGLIWGIKFDQMFSFNALISHNLGTLQWLQNWLKAIMIIKEGPWDSEYNFWNVSKGPSIAMWEQWLISLKSKYMGSIFCSLQFQDPTFPIGWTTGGLRLEEGWAIRFPRYSSNGQFYAVGWCLEGDCALLW